MWRLTFPLFKAFSCFWLSWMEKKTTTSHQIPWCDSWSHCEAAFHLASLAHTYTDLFAWFWCFSLFFALDKRTFSNWLCAGNINMKPNIAGVQTRIWLFFFKKGSKNTLQTVFVWAGLLWHMIHTQTQIHIHICYACGWWILHTFVPNNHNRQFHAHFVLSCFFLNF